VQKITNQLGKVTDALLEAENGVSPIAFIRKARELEEQLGAAEKKVQQLEFEVASMSSPVRPAQADRWEELASQVFAGDYSAREQVRQLIMDTFQRIVIYMRGMSAQDREGHAIDVQLLSRAGQHRLIQIDRRNGDWVASEDWE
jgi:hypothetical protein